MDEITIECQDCGAELTTQRHLLDTALNCPNCGNILAIDPSLLPSPDEPRKAVPPPLPGEGYVKMAGGKRVRLKANSAGKRRPTGVPRVRSGARRGLPDVQENYGRGGATDDVPGNSVVGIVIGSINVLLGVIALLRIVLMVVLMAGMGGVGRGGGAVAGLLLGMGCVGGLVVVAYLGSGVGLILQKRWGWVSTVILAVIMLCMGLGSVILSMALPGSAISVNPISAVTNIIYPVIVLALLSQRRVRDVYLRT